jgi:hypothetical protein
MAASMGANCGGANCVAIIPTRPASERNRYATAAFCKYRYRAPTPSRTGSLVCNYRGYNNLEGLPRPKFVQILGLSVNSSSARTYVRPGQPFVTSADLFACLYFKASKLSGVNRQISASLLHSVPDLSYSKSSAMDANLFRSAEAIRVHSSSRGNVQRGWWARLYQ